MRVVIDTNVIISAIGKKSPYRKLFDLILSGELELFISNDILNEYIEILEAKTNSEISNNFSQLLSMLPNVHFTNIFYRWNMIELDKDDNKFIDCYISSNSDFLITNDKHFDVVLAVAFPKINLISSDEFLNQIKI